MCRLHDRLGKLLPEKCFELKVPIGPLFAQLKAGRNITLPDGRIVLANDVRSANEPGAVFLIVECPDESFLDNFVMNESLNCYQTDNLKIETDAPGVVVHFTPEKVKYICYVFFFRYKFISIMVNLTVYFF